MLQKSKRNAAWGQFGTTRRGHCGVGCLGSASLEARPPKLSTPSAPPVLASPAHALQSKYAALGKEGAKMKDREERKARVIDVKAA